MAEQGERLRDLEAGTRQLEERCAELKDGAAGHEDRARAASAEVLKGNRIIEKLTVRLTPSQPRLPPWLGKICNMLQCPCQAPGGGRRAERLREQSWKAWIIHCAHQSATVSLHTKLPPALREYAGELWSPSRLSLYDRFLCDLTGQSWAVQADLRLARERLRRKAAIVARQEEEVTAKERALESASVDAQALQHALDQARSNAAKHEVDNPPIFGILV